MKVKYETLNKENLKLKKAVANVSGEQKDAAELESYLEEANKLSNERFDDLGKALDKGKEQAKYIKELETRVKSLNNSKPAA